MIDLRFPRTTINSDALDAELKGALGRKCFGFSIGDSGVTVHLADDSSLIEQEQVNVIVLGHDPAILTARQQADCDRWATILFKMSKPEAIEWVEAIPIEDGLKELVSAFVDLRLLLMGV